MREAKSTQFIFEIRGGRFSIRGKRRIECRDRVNTNDRTPAPFGAETPRKDDEKGATPQGAAPPPAPNVKKKKARKRRAKGAGHATNPAENRGGLHHAVREAMEAIRWTTLALARSRGQERHVEGVELKFKIRRDSSADALADEFFRQITARLDEARGEEDAVVPHRAFCFRCESFICEHSVPPDTRSVIARYEPTGRPVWIDFASLLYNRRDPRAEAVANRTPGILTLMIEAAELTQDRIEAFGGADPAVEILCELVAGMFTIENGGEDSEAALTLQWLRVRRHGRARVVFHPVADARLLNYAVTDPDLARLLTNERTAARTFGAAAAKKVPGGNDAAVKFAIGRAHGLARDLQHHYTVRSRRTLHARERAEVGVRPTANAFPEARAAADQQIMIDRKTGTFVLLGKNSRVHFFNKEARHVTSVRFSGEEIRVRIEKNRWCAATPAEIVAFRKQLTIQLNRQDHRHGE